MARATLLMLVGDATVSGVMWMVPDLAWSFSWRCASRFMYTK